MRDCACGTDSAESAPSSREALHLELTLDQFYTLLSSLEQVSGFVSRSVHSLTNTYQAQQRFGA